MIIPWIPVGWQVSNDDDLWAISCKTRTLNQRRPVKTGQKSSDDEVSDFGTLCKEGVLS